jgi:hypothetical protein
MARALLRAGIIARNVAWLLWDSMKRHSERGIASR